MRINLVTPFAEKDKVKALGAKWDGVRKVWYIVDVPDLAPFMRWIPDLAQAQRTVDPGSTQTASTRPRLQRPMPASTGLSHSGNDVPHCGCAVLPWEDCMHTVKL